MNPTLPKSIDENTEPRSADDIALEERLLALPHRPDGFVHDQLVAIEPVFAQPAEPITFDGYMLAGTVSDLAMEDNGGEALASCFAMRKHDLRFNMEIEVAGKILDPRNHSRRISVGTGKHPAWNAGGSDPQHGIADRANFRRGTRSAVMAPDVLRALHDRYVHLEDRASLATVLGLREVIVAEVKQFDGSAFRYIWGGGSVLLFDPDAPPVHVRRWHGEIPGASTRDGRFVAVRRGKDGNRRITVGSFYVFGPLDTTRAALITGCLAEKPATTEAAPA